MMRKIWKSLVRTLCFALLLAGMPFLGQRVNAEMTAVSVQETVEIKGIDGQTYTPASFGESVVALIFGRTSCGNTQGMIRAAEESLAGGCSVRIVLLCVDDTDSGMTSFAAAHPNVLVAGPQYNSVMWDLLRKCGLSGGGSIMLPGAFLMNKSRTIVFASTGYDGDGLKAALTAAEADTSAAEAPDTETSGKDDTNDTNDDGKADEKEDTNDNGTTDEKEDGKTGGKADTKVISLKKPQFTSAKRKAGTKVVLKWKKSVGADGYEIQMSTSKNKGFKKIKKGLAGKKTYTKTGVSKKKKYYFRIRSYKKVGKKTLYSAWSKVKAVK